MLLASQKVEIQLNFEFYFQFGASWRTDRNVLVIGLSTVKSLCYFSILRAIAQNCMVCIHVWCSLLLGCIECSPTLNYQHAVPLLGIIFFFVKWTKWIQILGLNSTFLQVTSRWRTSITKGCAFCSRCGHHGCFPGSRNLGSLNSVLAPTQFSRD